MPTLYEVIVHLDFATRVEAIQRQAAKIIIGAIICTAQNVMYGELGWTALSSWRKHDIWSNCN